MGGLRARWRAHPRTTDVAVPALLVLLLVVTAAHRPGGPWAVVWLVLTAVPLVWRRQHPVAVHWVVLALAAGQWTALTRPTGAAVPLVLVALHAVAVSVRGRALWTVVAGAAAAVVAGAAAVAGTTTPDGDVISFWVALVPLAALPAAVVLLGVNQRVRRAYLAALEERARRLETEREQRDRIAGAAERARIAREMHDVVAHSLTVVVTLADGIAARAGAVPPRPVDPAALRALSSTGRQALGEMRRLLGVLGDDAQDPAAAAGSRASRQPQPGVADLDALVEQVRAAGLAVVLTREGTAAVDGPGVGLAVYRIVQEALTNTLKHAGPGASAQVSVRADGDRVVVEVDDDGLGRARDPASSNGREAGAGGGRGLRGMAERAASFGGTSSAGPRQPNGWRVRAVLDLEHEAPATRPGPLPRAVPSR